MCVCTRTRVCVCSLQECLRFVNVLMTRNEDCEGESHCGGNVQSELFTLLSVPTNHWVEITEWWKFEKVLPCFECYGVGRMLWTANGERRDSGKYRSKHTLFRGGGAFIWNFVFSAAHLCVLIFFIACLIFVFSETHFDDIFVFA